MLALSKLKQNVNYIQTIGHTVIRLDVVDSTNNYAANLLSETNVVNGTVILAKNQISGRGQSGNSWDVESGENVTLSIILNQVPIKSEEQFFISQWISISIIDLLKNYDVDAEIKWPNDILVSNNKQKIAGILIENSLRGVKISNSIIGLGLNVNQSGYHKDINATSLLLEKNVSFDLDDVFDKLVAILNSNFIFLSTQKEKLRELYFSQLLGFDEYLNYKDSIEEFSAKIDSILPDGRLVLIDEKNRKRTYLFKEVSLIL